MSYETIGDCFYEDCRVFLSKFKAKESLRFDAFAEVWQEMKFSFVLSQWKYFGDMQQTIEEYLKICKRIWLKSETVTERVCGLYLVRAIYLKQPAAQYMKITLSQEDWQCMKHFLYVIKDFVQNETRYILQELFDLNAFAFSVPDCTSVRGKDDGGLSESVVAQFTKAHTLYNEMFLALQQENTEYNEQRRACLEVYPELSSFASAETDSLVEQLMAKLTVFEEEVNKIRANVQPATSLHVFDSATEETEGRKSTKKKKLMYRVTAIGDACETEESSDSRESTNFDMPQLHSEDSDESESTEEESRDAPTARTVDKVDIHMSDFDLSSSAAASEEEEEEDDVERSPKFPTATGSGSGSPTAASAEPGRPPPRSPTARRGRWFHGHSPSRGRSRSRGRGRLRIRGRGRSRW